MAQTNPPPGSSEEWFPVPGQASLRSAEHRPGEGEGAGGKAELAGPSPVVQHIIDQVDEVQPQLKVRPIGRDAVPEVARHQLAVRWGLGVAEHPVLPSLQQPGWWVSEAGLLQAKVCIQTPGNVGRPLPAFHLSWWGSPRKCSCRKGMRRRGAPRAALAQTGCRSSHLVRSTRFWEHAPSPTPPSPRWHLWCRCR